MFLLLLLLRCYYTLLESVQMKNLIIAEKILFPNKSDGCLLKINILKSIYEMFRGEGLGENTE